MGPRKRTSVGGAATGEKRKSVGGAATGGSAGQSGVVGVSLISL